MAQEEKYHFGGYATRNDLRCSDGRTIRADAFKGCDGKIVPLVWNHRHESVDNVLGHSLLENRPDGVYCYNSFNDTPLAQHALKSVQHGDITSLSIYANQLVQNGSDVVHGVIREVSLVLGGANPGALIDNVAIAHGDGVIDTYEDQAVIYSGTELDLDPVRHAGEEPEPDDDGGSTAGENATMQDILNDLSDDQKVAVGVLLQSLIGNEEEPDDETVSHSDEEGTEEMPIAHNVFDNNGGNAITANALSREDQNSIIQHAMTNGMSLRNAVREYALAHSITSIEELFPEFHNVDQTPKTVAPEMEWVPSVWNGASRSPFSRLKTRAFDITAKEARARGYVKGEQKQEEVIKQLHRTVTPQTIYKLQKLDRDDIIDITDFDVVSWIKAEMRTMLEYEIARAALIGDGREEGNDKIKEENIIPIAYDNETFSVHKLIDTTSVETDTEKAELFMDTVLSAMNEYKGSGSPTMFIGKSMLTSLRMLRDKIGRRLYKSDQEIADELRVARIVPVDLIDTQSRKEPDPKGEAETWKLMCVIVNIRDYTFGANRGGQVTMFDDFDIDYNKYSYLIETRLSGMLTVPKSAVVIEDGKASVAV